MVTDDRILALLFLAWYAAAWFSVGTDDIEP